MRIGITSNHKNAQSPDIKTFIDILNQNNIDYAVDSCIGFEGKKLNSYNHDILAVFGGDGTIIKHIKKSSAHGIPVLGINSGNLGFLSEIEKTQLNDGVKRLKDNNFFVEKRAMIEVQSADRVYTAINEVAVKTSGGHAVHISVSIKDGLIERFFGDGVIVATPTGSTAYSLSAGGPVVSSNVEAFILTAICPHTLSNRPIVLSDKEIITVTYEESRCHGLMYIDGENTDIKFRYGDKLTIKKSQTNAMFVRFSENFFFDRLATKLKKWSND